ncbi:MAG: hypothetical protein EXR72_04625 [Myxococcales bacterium]|nr:hypothetical protein [Myxococcales bacterium]
MRRATCLGTGTWLLCGMLAGCGAATLEPGGGVLPPGQGQKDGGPGGGGGDGGGGGGDAGECMQQPMGCGGDNVIVLDKLDPMENGSSGVKNDQNGGLIIDPGNFGSTNQPIIWVANSQEGTVSKIETRNMKEVGRYRTGPGGSPDPSRTTVGLSGDVVVANRFGHSATKIAADSGRCMDKNGDGKIDTSTGSGDVKPWGQDECVLWNTPFPNGSIARAAAYDAEVGMDGDDSSTVWIGLYALQQMRQLDSKTGKELATVDVSPIHPYGAAIDKDGNVWVWGGGVVKIDKQHKVTKIPNPPCAYGIACDPQGRVWVSGQGCVARWTPAQNKWDSINIGGFNRGLAVDAKGSVWVADTNFGVHQIDTNTLQSKKNIGLGSSNFVGMAIDFDGMVWTVSQGSSKATKIDPANYQTTPISVGNGPYTYSDMTGFQLRNAAAPFGKYRHVFQGCAKDAKFLSLSWKAMLPPGTTVVVKGRVGANAAALAAAPWVLLATSPPDVGPVNLEQVFGNKMNIGALFETEVTLKSLSPDSTPILQSLTLVMSCTPGIG